jgi:hypothetical protein
VLDQHHPQVNGQLAKGHCDGSVNLLAQYIDENGIDIAYSKYNTRTIGKSSSSGEMKGRFNLEVHNQLSC